jgi:hypothetical protein
MPIIPNNLGWVKSVFKGITPPSNTDMLWFDDNVGVKKHKYYDTQSSTWKLFQNTLFFDTFSNFPPSGLADFLYIDKGGKKTYIYDTLSGYVLVGGGAGVNGLTDAGRQAARNGGTSVGDDIIVDPTQLTSTQSIQNTLVSPTKARLSDQLLPFDITLVGANEYGHTTKMVIYGVEIMSESGGVSIDDMVLEKQMQFLARSISNWEAIDTANSR